MKNKLIKKIIFSTILLVMNSQSTLAGMQSKVMVHGTLEKYDDDIAIIRTKSGGKAKVPYRSISSEQRSQMHPGSQVKANVEIKELIKLNKQKKQK